MNPHLLQPVESDGHVLEAAGLADEEQSGVTGRHAPQLTVQLGPVPEEVIDTALRQDLWQRGWEVSQSGLREKVRHGGREKR